MTIQVSEFGNDIPVDIKSIADQSMHSISAVIPSQKWLACQSMDNKIIIFSTLNGFKMNRKKTFTVVAGYACGLAFPSDMSYLIVSGDTDDKFYIWNWKTMKLYKK